MILFWDIPRNQLSLESAKSFTRASAQTLARMRQFKRPQRLLCLSCAALFDHAELVEGGYCPECNAPIDVDELIKLYEYAAETHYYGHQYRVVYEAQFKGNDTGTRFSLEFAGEAFAWIMLAMLSGVFGNTANDILKIVIARIKEGVAAGKISDRDYTYLLTLSDGELGDILYSAKQYVSDMEGLTREVREAIAEEIAADAASHSPEVAEEMLNLMDKKTVKPKDLQRFAHLMRHAIVQQQKRSRPNLQKLSESWKSVS